MKKIIILFITLFICSYSNTFEQASMHYKNKEFNKSFLIYKDLAYLGNINAQYNLGIFYYNGIGVRKNKDLAFIWLSTAAKKSHKLAQNKVGYMYEYGEVSDDKAINKALTQYKKSANQDYEIAQLNLAMHYNQKANQKSFEQAFYWYEKAMNNGNVAAINNIANMYYFGQGIAKSYKKAATLYKEAANKGDKLAQYNLSMMYFSGEYFKKDGDSTLYWLEKSALNGYKVAQLKLANFFKEGDNAVVNKDHKKALYWYFKAAKQNYAPAQYYVGYFYYYGFAVKKDLKIAAYWMDKSKNNGYASAKRFMIRNKLYY